MTGTPGALRTATADLNGIARGKRLPGRMADKLMAEGLRLPLSALNLDVWGEDIAGSPLVFAGGDPDGVARPTGRGPLPVPWLAGSGTLMPMWMFHEDGRAFEGDARQALSRLLDRFSKRGLVPLVGSELEFHLLDDSRAMPRPAASPRSGHRRPGGDILSLRQLDDFEVFFADLYEGAEAMGLRAGAAISEGSPGQFEVTLDHREAMRAADDAWLFKMLVHGMARKHGMAASFMAKPLPDHPGNGLHVHVSVMDGTGANVFDDGTERGSQTLRQAIGGCLALMAEATLVFAPHGPSYDRFVPGAHAPTGISWGYENRTVALRVPGGAPAARRLEHRLAGGDANPYLMFGAVLGGVLEGIAAPTEPPAPLTGNAYEKDLDQVPRDWITAIDGFAASHGIARIFAPQLIANFVATKRQEARKLADLDAASRRALYLDIV